MIYDMNDLRQLAYNAVDMPNGCGDHILSKNSESWAPYVKFLYSVVFNYRPPVCLELGVYMGTATCHMALGSRDTMVIGVDRDFHPAVWRNTERFVNIILVEGDSTLVETRVKVGNALPWNRLQKERIGLIFLDSTHDGETPKKELELYAPYMHEECIVACDDLLGPEHLKKKMQEFWTWLPGEKEEMHFLHPALNRSHDEPGFGISIIRR